MIDLFQPSSSNSKLIYDILRIMTPRRKHYKREYELNHPARVDTYSVYPLKKEGENTASPVYDGPQNYLKKLFRDPFFERDGY